jgi:hypothetical protein
MELLRAGRVRPLWRTVVLYLVEEDYQSGRQVEGRESGLTAQRRSGRLTVPPTIER